MFLKILYVLHCIIVFFLILLIFIQQGKGANIGMLIQTQDSQKHRQVFNNYSINFKFIFFLIFLFFFITIFLNKLISIENVKMKNINQLSLGTVPTTTISTQEIIKDKKKIENSLKQLPNIPK